MARLSGFFLLVFAFSGLAAEHNVLLPRPQKIVYGSGSLKIAGLAVEIAPRSGREVRFAARELARALPGGVPVVDAKHAGAAIVLRLTGNLPALPQDKETTGPESRESYRLKITPQGAEIAAPSSAGLFYGVQTMRQLVEPSDNGPALPAVEIEDWPAMAYRGFMMDASHGPLPTEAEVEREIDFLARWKANQYFLYSELSIELKGYPLLMPEARYSQEQVRRIIEYARQRHVDVVPCLEFYGHLHDLFRVERYAKLGALPHGRDFDARNPEVAALVKDWITQMAALFPSPWFHVGLDEPWEVMHDGGHTADSGALYIEHLKRVVDLVESMHKRALYWADIDVGAATFSRHPQLFAQLPPNAIAVPWDYDTKKDYVADVQPFARNRIAQVVAPAVWYWNEIVPDYNRTFANIDGIVADGRKYGSIGVLNTNWADDGQVLYRMTLPGIAYGAVAGWQSGPVDREHFFANYAGRAYDRHIAPAVAAALAAMNDAQQQYQDAVGGDTIHRFWEDPFDPACLERAKAHRAELRNARLSAETAEAQLLGALEMAPSDAELRTLLLGARMLDYAALKSIYAVEIAEFFEKLGAHPKREEVGFYIGGESAAEIHSRLEDLMDANRELREQYRAAWLAEYVPFRLQKALGRWDAQFEYWRRMETAFHDFSHTFRDGDVLPPVQAFRPWKADPAR